MAGWLQNIFGHSKHQSRSPEVPQPEFKPTKLPPRKDEVAESKNQAAELTDKVTPIKAETSLRVETASLLRQFEVQILPHEFRFAINRNADGIIEYKPENDSTCHPFLLLMKKPGHPFEPVFGSLCFLLEKHKILDVPMNLPENVFLADTMKIPSVHLRFRYSNCDWRSWYLKNKIPQNIQVFLDDCYQLAVKVTTVAPQMVDQASELNLFELQVSPLEFRFAVAPGRDALIGFDRRVLLLPAAESKGLIDLALLSLHELLQKHNIRGTSCHHSEKVMQPGTTSLSSLHLRFRYGNRGWASFYLTEEIPPNVRALLEDCHHLANEMAKGSKQLSNEEIQKRLQQNKDRI